MCGFSPRPDRGPLRRRGERAVERLHLPPARPGTALQQLLRLPDLERPGEKDENPRAFRETEALHFRTARPPHLLPDRDRLHRPVPPALRRRRRPVLDLHRKEPTARLQHITRLQVIRQARGLEGRRHHEHRQVRPAPLLQVEDPRQRDVGCQAAFVKLVEDHRPHPIELGILAHPPLQDTVRQVKDPGALGVVRIEAHRVADFPAQLNTERSRHELRQEARGNAPRLHHQDAPVHHAGIEQHRRHPGRLSRSGRRAQERPATRRQGCPQFALDLKNG